MITAKEAKEKTLSNSVEFFINSIEAEILKGISDNRFHCIWYTPPIYNCTKEDLVKIDMIKEYLISIGYSCHTTTFIPNKNFNNTRVKLYISWE